MCTGKLRYSREARVAKDMKRCQKDDHSLRDMGVAFIIQVNLDEGFQASEPHNIFERVILAALLRTVCCITIEKTEIPILELFSAGER